MNLFGAYPAFWMSTTALRNELHFSRPVTLNAQRFFKRRHGDEGVDAEMPGGFEPDFRVPVGQKMGVKIDNRARNFGSGHGLMQIEAQPVVIRRFRRADRKLLFCNRHYR